MSNDAEKCWLIQSGSEPAGPYSLAQLRALAQCGRISRSTLIRDLRSSSWLVASQLPELFQQVVLTTKVASHAKSTQPQTTPNRLVPLTATAPSAHNSISPHIPSGFGQRGDFASARPAITVAVVASAVGSTFIVILIFLAMQSTRDERPVPTAVDGSLATAIPTTSALHASADAKASASSSQSAVYSTEELVSRTQQSVAAVITNQGGGSGFMVARNVMATNYHVIADSLSNEITVVFPDGAITKQGPFQAMVIAEQPDRDLALLRIDAEIPTLDVYPNYKFRRGQDIVIIGTPALFRGRGILPNAVTRGVLSSQAELDGFEHYQLSLAVNSGNSGGPVFGMDGRVIGVVVSKSVTEESIGFCIPAYDLESLVQSQQKTNFAPTAKTAAMHDARRWIRTVVDQILTRDVFMTEYISQINAPLATASASRFLQEMKQWPLIDSSDLFKSYEVELGSLVQNQLLEIDVRRAISGIHRRHLVINRLLLVPSGNFENFVNQLDSLNNDFFAYLSDADNLLQIGRPALLKQ